MAFADAAPGVSVAAEQSGQTALKLINTQIFQLIIVDTNVSDMDINDLLRGIYNKHKNIPVIMLASEKVALSGDLQNRELHTIFKPLDEGYDQNLKTVTRGIRMALSKLSVSALDLPPESWHSQKRGEYSMLLIAASTGGPIALQTVLSGLSKSINVPVMIVQHMPAGFTKNFAENLARQTMLKIKEAEEGMGLMPGEILIAPGGFHMCLDAGKRISLNENALVNGVRPSADVLFESVAKRFSGEKILCVIMTGMGSDGTAGIRALKQSCRCYTITQNEESCTVYGMPRAVVEAGLSDMVVPLSTIATSVNNILGLLTVETKGAF